MMHDYVTDKHIQYLHKVMDFMLSEYNDLRESLGADRLNLKDIEGIYEQNKECMQGLDFSRKPKNARCKGCETINEVNRIKQSNEDLRLDIAKLELENLSLRKKDSGSKTENQFVYDPRQLYIAKLFSKIYILQKQENYFNWTTFNEGPSAFANIHFTTGQEAMDAMYKPKQYNFIQGSLDHTVILKDFIRLAQECNEYHG